MKVHFRTISVAQGRCFHASAVCVGKVYMHGGLHRYPSDNIPLNDVVLFDPSNSSLSSIKSKNEGPARSHHTAAPLSNHTMCVVGGWDGKRRTADVWFLDVLDLQWTMGKPTSLSNPPAGLSSHTCTLLNPHEMVVTGREGGVHMQRRYGSVFKLKIDSAKKMYTYEELPYHIGSRAGHTACVLSKSVDSAKGTHLVVVGGRDSKDADRFPISSVPLNPDLGHLLHKVVKSDIATAFHSIPIRNHASVPAGDMAVVQGGEIYGRMRDNILCDFFIHDSVAVKWWKVNISGSNDALIRMGHSLVWMQGRIYVIGGTEKQRGEASHSVIEIEFNS